MNNSYDNELEELEVEEVFDAKELERELNEILEEDDEDIDDDRLDELDKLFAQKYEARKHKSVLQARRRKRQLKRLGIVAAVISVLLLVSVIAFFVVLMRDATSTLKAHNTDILAETRAIFETKNTADIVGDIEGIPLETDIVELGQDSTVFSEQVSSTQPESTKAQESTKDPETEKVTETEKVQGTTKAPVTVKPTQSVTNSKYVSVTDSGIAADYVALYDVSTGALIAGRKPYDRMFPASMTKVMTLIVACENITDWNKSTALTEAEANYLYNEDASRAVWDSGSYLTAKDLIYGLVLRSGCDAAMMLARITSGSEAEFAKLMNMKCKELGISNTTHFVNSTGLHNDNQYTTAADMCKIMEYAMKNELCAKVLGTASYTYTKNGAKYTWKHFNYQWYNEKYYYNDTIAKNSLTKRGFSVIGAKSGYTSKAERCLVTCFIKNDKKYITVVAHSDTVYLSTQDSTNVILKYGP